MKMPFGPNWFQNLEWNLRNLIMAGIPGFENVATALMRNLFGWKKDELPESPGFVSCPR
jgi:hypothetical protein